MKKALKALMYIIGILIVVIGSGLTYVKLALPSIETPKDFKVERTPARLERGAYLANSVTVCMDCHSTRDWSTYAGPMDPKTAGSGGEVFNKQMGFPGEFIAPNITPAGLRGWTDADLYRAITSGVSRDGHALFPIMPYPNFGKMDKEDVYSLIAYIRSLQPIDKPNGISSADFPVNFIINTIPAPANHQKMPSPNDAVAYGGYLVNAAGCSDCHTRSVDGTPVEGMGFAGGFEFKFPSATAYSANITPDQKTGIGAWSKEQFVARFKMYSDSTYQRQKLGAKDGQTPMPWLMYTHMKVQDLEAIYAYLRTVKPIDNQVIKFVAN